MKVGRTWVISVTLAIGSLFAASAYALLDQSKPDWSDLTTATAAAYCIAHHPNFNLDPAAYAPDGFETASSPGVVGAVRRNFVSTRSTLSQDEGTNNNCEKACSEFGKGYTPNYKGAALHQKYGTSAHPQVPPSTNQWHRRHGAVGLPRPCMISTLARASWLACGRAATTSSKVE
jgi:hypothetical protein